MADPSIGLIQQMLRRRPVIDAPVAHGASDHLKRSIAPFNSPCSVSAPPSEPASSSCCPRRFQKPVPGLSSHL